MSDPLRVSIIVPSYNQGRYIRATLDSILAQDYQPLEVWVIDGASTDNTVSILKEYDQYPHIHWLSEPDNGVVDAVNKGFARVQGDIIGIQSSDDYYLPNTIQTAVTALQNQPDIGLIYGDIEYIDAQGKAAGQSHIAPYSHKGLLAKTTWIPQPSAFFRRQFIDKLGGWRENVAYAADTDLWLRMAFHTQMQKIDTVLARYRRHPEQRATQAKKIIRDHHTMLATLPALKHAPASLRRAARAGQAMVQRRYDTSGSEWQRSVYLFRAWLLCPEIFPQHNIHWRWVVPGYMALKQQLARLKKCLTTARHT